MTYPKDANRMPHVYGTGEFHGGSRPPSWYRYPDDEEFRGCGWYEGFQLIEAWDWAPEGGLRRSNTPATDLLEYEQGEEQQNKEARLESNRIIQTATNESSPTTDTNKKQNTAQTNSALMLAPLETAAHLNLSHDYSQKLPLSNARNSQAEEKDGAINEIIDKTMLHEGRKESRSNFDFGTTKPDSLWEGGITDRTADQSDSREQDLQRNTSHCADHSSSKDMQDTAAPSSVRRCASLDGDAQQENEMEVNENKVFITESVSTVAQARRESAECIDTCATQGIPPCAAGGNSAHTAQIVDDKHQTQSQGWRMSLAQRRSRPPVFDKPLQQSISENHGQCLQSNGLTFLASPNDEGHRRQNSPDLHLRQLSSTLDCEFQIADRRLFSEWRPLALSTDLQDSKATSDAAVTDPRQDKLIPFTPDWKSVGTDTLTNVEMQTCSIPETRAQDELQLEAPPTSRTVDTGDGAMRLLRGIKDAAAANTSLGPERSGNSRVADADLPLSPVLTCPAESIAQDQLLQEKKKLKVDRCGVAQHQSAGDMSSPLSSPPSPMIVLRESSRPVTIGQLETVVWSNSRQTFNRSGSVASAASYPHVTGDMPILEAVHVDQGIVQSLTLKARGRPKKSKATASELGNVDEEPDLTAERNDTKRSQDASARRKLASKHETGNNKVAMMSEFQVEATATAKKSSELNGNEAGEDNGRANKTSPGHGTLDQALPLASSTSTTNTTGVSLSARHPLELSYGKCHTRGHSRLHETRSTSVASDATSASAMQSISTSVRGSPRGQKRKLSVDSTVMELRILADPPGSILRAKENAAKNAKGSKSSTAARSIPEDAKPSKSRKSSKTATQVIDVDNELVMNDAVLTSKRRRKIRTTNAATSQVVAIRADAGTALVSSARHATDEGDQDTQQHSKPPGSSKARSASPEVTSIETKKKHAGEERKPVRRSRRSSAVLGADEQKSVVELPNKRRKVDGKAVNQDKTGIDDAEGKGLKRKLRSRTAKK